MPILLPRNQGLIKPAGSAVQIVTGHHLAIGLRFAPIFTAAGGFKVWDPVKQQSMTFSTGATWVRGPHGPAMAFAGTAGQQAAGTGLLLSGRPWTISAKYRVIVDEQHYWWTLGAEATDTLMHINDYFADGMDVNLYSDDFHFGVPAKTLGVWMHFHITQASSKVISLYKNGVLVSTNTATGMFTGTNGDWTLGGRTVGGTDYFKGEFDHFMLWDRALGPREIQEHVAGPYRMFAPAVWRRYSLPASAGVSGAFTAQAGSQAQDVATKAGSAAPATRAGTRAQDAAAKAIAAAPTTRAGADAQDVGVHATAAAATVRNGARAQAAAVHAVSAAPVARAAARAQCVGVKAVSSAPTVRSGADATTAATMKASAAILARAGSQAQTGTPGLRTGSFTAQSGTRSQNAAVKAAQLAITAQSGTRSQCSGVKSFVVATQARAGLRPSLTVSRSATASIVARTGVESACTATHLHSSALLGRAGARSTMATAIAQVPGTVHGGPRRIGSLRAGPELVGSVHGGPAQ